MTSLKIGENNQPKKKKKKKGKLKWLFRDALFCTVLSLAAFGLVANLILSTSYFNPLLHSIKDFSFLDAYYEGNFSGLGEVDSTLVLVNIGDLDRQGIADLIDEIQKQEPEVLGLDIIFKDKGLDFTDSILLKAVSKESVVMSYVRNPDTLDILGDIVPLNASIGYVNFTSIRPTEVTRRFVGIEPSGEGNAYGLASQMLRQYQKGRIWNANGYSRKLLRERRIKFYGHFEDFLHYEGRDLLSKKVNPRLKGKMVLIGYAGFPTGNPYDVEDKHFTPLNEFPLGKGIPDMFGIAVHANIVNMLLKNDFFWELGIFGKVFLIFLFSYLASFYLIWLDRKLKISYRTVRKLILFVFALIFVGFSLWLFVINMVVEPTLIVITTIFTASFVKYYKHLVRYIKTKRKFKSYIK